MKNILNHKVEDLETREGGMVFTIREENPESFYPILVQAEDRGGMLLAYRVTKEGLKSIGITGDSDIVLKPNQSKGE
jgi:hypothetical protein